MCDIQGLERKWRVSVCPRYRLATAAYVSAVLPPSVRVRASCPVAVPGTFVYNYPLTAGRDVGRRMCRKLGRNIPSICFRTVTRFDYYAPPRSIRTRSRIHSLSEDQQRTRARPRLNQPVSDALACFGG